MDSLAQLINYWRRELRRAYRRRTLGPQWREYAHLALKELRAALQQTQDKPGAYVLPAIYAEMLPAEYDAYWARRERRVQLGNPGHDVQGMDG